MRFVQTVFASLLVAACAVSASSAIAAPTVITFDANDPIGGLAVGATLGNQYAAYGVIFVPNAYSGTASPTGGWATNTAMNIVSASGGDVGGFGSPSLVSGNLLRGFNGWLGENGDPSFSALFGGGINAFSADFAGVSNPADVHLFAYLGSTLIGSATSAVLTGQFTLSFASASLFDRVVITPGSFDDWVGVDNITFSSNAVAPGDVPEPASMALLALGLSGMALARRRQRG